MSRAPSLRPRERGAALVVALVTVLMLSILGLEAMRGATLEGRLADNALHKEITFQAAESSTDAVLASPNALEDIICAADVERAVPQVNAVPAQVTRATLSYGGRTNPPGYSLDRFSGRRFMVVGDSALPGVSTRTRIAQGVELIGAAGPSGGC